MGYIIKLCFANLKLRRLRTALTITGIMIGIMSIVTMLTAGIGARQAMVDEVEKTGNTRDIHVTSINTLRKDMLLTDSVVEDFSKLDKVYAVYTIISAPGQEKYGSFTGWSDISGVTKEYMDTLTIAQGTMPKSNGSRPELLVGMGFRDSLYNEKNWVSYGDSQQSDETLAGRKMDFIMDILQQEDKDYQVVDVFDESFSEDTASNTASEKLNEETTSGTQMNLSEEEGIQGLEEGGNPDTFDSEYEDEETATFKLNIVGETDNEYDYGIYTDMDTLKAFLKRQAVDGKIPGQPLDKNNKPYSGWCYSEVIVRARSVADVEKLSKIIKDEGFQVENNLEMLNSVNRTIDIVQLVLGAIGAIAGLVAIIGIINTMMTAVYDRVKEIGLLKMLGAQSDDISFMFLFESGLLGTIGGILGVGLSLIIDIFINRKLVQFMNMPEGTWVMATPAWLIVGAVFMSIIVSILAGAFPTRWAVKIKPLDAMTRN